MDPTIHATSRVTATPTPPAMDAETPQTPTSPTTFLAPELDPSPPSKKYTEPLYTEINIPLPPVPKPKSKPLPPSTSRPRAHSLASFRPFHRRGSSADSGVGKEEAWPRIKKEVKSKEVAAAMSLTGRDRRSGTVDALAVVPALLVLGAELFTPGEEGKKKKRDGKWEDALVAFGGSGGYELFLRWYEGGTHSDMNCEHRPMRHEMKKIAPGGGAKGGPDGVAKRHAARESDREV